MIYRLLVVDDEPIIVHGLVHALESADELHVEVHRSYSSSSALEILKQTKMDIVLTDINMPGASGLSLQKEIKNRWPACKVIFLTGHDDFQYIHEATRQGTLDYILKTEGNDAVLRAVEKAVRILDQEMESRHWIAQAQERLLRARPFLQKQYISDLLKGRSHTLSEIERWFHELEMELNPYDPCLLLIGRVDTWREGHASSHALDLYALQNIVQELLSPMVCLIAAEYDRSRIIWVIQCRDHIGPDDLNDRERREQVMCFVHGTMERIQQVAETLLQLQVSLACSSQWSAWSQLADKVEDIKLLLGSGLGIGAQTLLIEEAAVEQNIHARNGNTPLLRSGTSRRNGAELLRFCIEQGNRDEFHSVFHALMGDTLYSNDADTALNMEIYYDVVSMYLPYLTRLHLTAHHLETSDKLVDLEKLTRYELHDSWKQAADYLIETGDLIFQAAEQGRYEEEHEVVAKVNRYIERNLGGDLSLTRIGEAVGHNPSYLSRLYKQISGEGLSETIHAARLNRAKQLLQETDTKVHEIATALGFISPPYFYRFFKKATHLTPQQYRELVNK
ncbi:response regulator [Paenibacillus lemnae]|uniref:Response regulator n=1 Tax=Paenibacillus lemnae TaxID=1330551 RepID=A0A848MAZ7_PAELE|nr:response regulator [Paenibacillus lemnae]NMO97706.1 response regulator [Paenibacillus lemnae]